MRAAEADQLRSSSRRQVWPALNLARQTHLTHAVRVRASMHLPFRCSSTWSYAELSCTATWPVHLFLIGTAVSFGGCQPRCPPLPPQPCPQPWLST
jgi:hypothetical protein